MLLCVHFHIVKAMPRKAFRIERTKNYKTKRFQQHNDDSDEDIESVNSPTRQEQKISPQRQERKMAPRLPNPQHRPVPKTDLQRRPETEDDEPRPTLDVTAEPKPTMEEYDGLESVPPFIDRADRVDPFVRNAPRKAKQIQRQSRQKYEDQERTLYLKKKPSKATRRERRRVNRIRAINERRERQDKYKTMSEEPVEEKKDDDWLDYASDYFPCSGCVGDVRPVYWSDDESDYCPRIGAARRVDRPRYRFLLDYESDNGCSEYSDSDDEPVQRSRASPVSPVRTRDYIDGYREGYRTGYQDASANYPAARKYDAPAAPKSPSYQEHSYENGQYGNKIYYWDKTTEFVPYGQKSRYLR